MEKKIDFERFICAMLNDSKCNAGYIHKNSIERALREQGIIVVKTNNRYAFDYETRGVDLWADFVGWEIQPKYKSGFKVEKGKWYTCTKKFRYKSVMFMKGVTTRCFDDGILIDLNGKELLLNDFERDGYNPSDYFRSATDYEANKYEGLA